ncbi:MAG TPA: cytochrome c oxidase subunit II [Gemmataceae bacterium]|nr:cytochrome c oxidase subunit II [Gemmataceae bacterium]
MFAQVPLYPEQASSTAERVDALFLFQLAITSAMGVLVSCLIIYFVVRYRRRPGRTTPRITGSMPLELAWSIVPFIIFLVMFVWGAEIFLNVAEPPPDAMEIFVVGKRWMWKFQHQTGQREINEIHVPLGRPVKLTLISEDVIHDLFVPAFRTKIDVLPGRYVQTWFKATKPGRYHLFCSQYCGTNHSGMVGWVTVQEPSDFSDWLTGRAEGSLALQGRKLFLKLQCVTCHSADARARAPVLEGLFGQTVVLQDGRRVIADEAYLRESILNPRAKIVASWEPIMPTFDGQLADPSEDLTQEEALIRLLAFLKALKPGQTPVRTEDFPPPAVNPKAEKDKGK